jgi:hypothetical protein
MAKLVAQYPGRAKWKEDLAWFDKQFGALNSGGTTDAKQ